ncbi:MAG: LLM class flavin-dependent oxidoreductase [Salinirussus sp.]
MDVPLVVAMRIGVALPSYGNDDWRFPTGALEAYADDAERLGFSGLWVMEHLLQPPGRSYSWLDPLTTLATMVGSTNRVELGTSVLLLPLRKPVLAAHRAASLQHLSDERLTLGLGIGWSEREYAAAEVPFEERGPRFTEAIELFRRLLHEDTVTFDGEFYTVEDVRLEPSTPRPPRILIGGGGIEQNGQRSVPVAVKDRIARHADGWIAGADPPDAVEQDWHDIADHVAAAGEDPATLDRVVLQRAYLVPGADAATACEKQRSVFGRKADPETAMAEYLTGTVADVRQALGAYRDMGVDQVILDPVTPRPPEARDQLQRYATHLTDVP